MHHTSSPNVSVMDIFFPGFTGFTAALHQLLSGNLDSYAALLCIYGMLMFSGKLLCRTVGSFVDTYFTTKTDVHDPDEAYDMLECWVSAQDFAKNACSSLVSVDSRRGRALIHPDCDTAAKKPLRFTPWRDRLSFWYKGHLLFLQCTQNEVALFPRKTMTVSCVGRSSQILRDLMDECRFDYLKLSENKTSIFEHHNNGWKRTITRDTRPIETVVMKEELKQMLLKDIRSFLDPRARSWYASRGLPYRRGYLLYGRPGTGKSSLSMSIAGCFGLDIYVLSLAGINDGRLSALFAELPQRCVVLLEDVDAVGTTRSRGADTDESDSGSEVSRSSPKPSGSLSLSGLLNVLDGVASQEGRVLIMTTNHIEHLDGALIRPGRVDKKIEFELADAEVVRKLFCTVFEQSEEEMSDAETRDKSNEDVRQLAVRFAGAVPELEFSPADILSFLLANRGSPSSALADAEGWVFKTRKGGTLRRCDSWGQSD
ncbi:mitochondrial chaperone bcs1 [Colletotrichum orchidophilum]|uniref:Mitochondrial chaperone bcs1 n=1 Tax=Colletotrichum orchidophilum TaxID=1209926 RepID=A0A1G4AMI1_9PEZI|nr:mitochondrial chaperone bcs1 [Colletotrichum orchidophilum]OHE90316.1 mitochondrial chaperone bcs1 [Colletotrichum orchidophilum]